MNTIIGNRIIQYSEIDSTNDEAKRLIKKGVGEGAVIIADSQTGGRGKPGYGWFSPPGVGIYLSAIVKPFRNPRELAPITMLGARAVVKTIKELTGLQAEIKLPNDVLLNGEKICGVLLERVTSGHLIIGIGVNINNPIDSFPDDIKKSATSLKIEAQKEFDPRNFREILINKLDEEYQRTRGNKREN